MNVAVSLAKSILAALGITAAAPVIDAGIQKKIHASGVTTLIISNEEMNDIMKIDQALKDSNISLKGVTKTITNETTEQKGGFLSMFLGTLGAILLGNVLPGKGAIARRQGRRIVRTGYGAKRAGYGLKKKILIPPHPLINFEIQKYYENKSRFNGVFSRDNLPKTKKKWCLRNKT